MHYDIKHETIIRVEMSLAKKWNSVEDAQIYLFQDVGNDLRL